MCCTVLPVGVLLIVRVDVRDVLYGIASWGYFSLLGWLLEMCCTVLSSQLGYCSLLGWLLEMCCTVLPVGVLLIVRVAVRDVLYSIASWGTSHC